MRNEIFYDSKGNAVAPGYVEGKHNRRNYWWIENEIRQDIGGRTDLINYLIKMIFPSKNYR
mgnify:CR=1 FL=1